MKKTFLSLVFALTMGVSLFAGSIKKANAQVVVDDFNHTVTMTTSDSYTFTCSTISIVDGTSITLSGKTITSVGVGVTSINIDGIIYQINVNLPSEYTYYEYASFLDGAVLDTGYAFTSDNVYVRFNYTGKLVDKAFGTCMYNSGIIPQYGQIWCGKGLAETKVGTGISDNHDEKTTLDFRAQDSQVSLTYNGTLYNAQLVGSMVNAVNFKFGKCGGNTEKIGFSGNLYDLYIESEGVCVRNFVACKNNSTGNVGFYDLITKNFYSSSTDVPIYRDTGNIDIYYQENENIQIRPQDKVMYLGSDVDFTHMEGKLIVPEGTVLRGSISGASITVSDGSSIDLRTIFGQNMTAGVKYGLSLTDGFGNSSTIIIVKSENIATVYVNCALSYHDLTSSKDNVTTGSIVLNDGSLTISANLNSFKGRGNSFSQDKKNSFNLKLDSKQTLIPGAESQKKYCLIGPNVMETHHLNNQSGYFLYQQLSNNGDAIAYRMVNFYYNNTFMGFYMLTEKPEISKTVVNITEPDMIEGTAVRNILDVSQKTAEEKALYDLGIPNYKYCTDADVTSSGGFIIEAGYYYGSATSGFKTSHGNTWEVKDPKGVSFKQLSSVATFMKKAEDALFSSTGFNSDGKHYSEYFDLDSLARNYLIRSFTMDCDFLNTSFYFYIDGDDDGVKGKMYCGPVWDLNYNKSGDTSKLYHSNPYSPCKNFRDMLMEKGDFVSLMNEINQNEFNSIVSSWIDSNNTTTKTIHDVYSQTIVALSLDDARWGKNNAYNYNLARNGIVNRGNYWPTIWSDETNALRGVKITDNSSQLVASAYGASSYQWYKWDSKNNEGIEIPGATSSTYSPSRSGVYYVVVNGDKSLAGLSITQMTSNPLKYTCKKYSSSYASLASALEDTEYGDILYIDLNYDISSNCTIKEGVTVDLNGFDIINDKSITINGQIIDTSNDKGILNSNSLSFSDEQKYLPIFDSAKGGYAFYNVSIEEQISANNKLQFRMKQTSTECNDALDLIGTSISNSKIKACVTVAWKDNEGGSIIDKEKTIEFADSWMSYVINGDGASPIKTYSRVFNFSIKNLADLISAGKVKMQCSFAVYNGEEKMFATKGNMWETTDGLIWKA